jgi:hypothetical protein
MEFFKYTPLPKNIQDEILKKIGDEKRRQGQG